VRRMLGAASHSGCFKTGAVTALASILFISVNAAQLHSPSRGLWASSGLPTIQPPPTV
jgi:hypothetical protein